MKTKNIFGCVRFMIVLNYLLSEIVQSYYFHIL